MHPLAMRHCQKALPAACQVRTNIAKSRTSVDVVHELWSLLPAEAQQSPSLSGY